MNYENRKSYNNLNNSWVMNNHFNENIKRDEVSEDNMNNSDEMQVIVDHLRYDSQKVKIY
jgi:hypothetical protein